MGGTVRKWVWGTVIDGEAWSEISVHNQKTKFIEKDGGHNHSCGPWREIGFTFRSGRAPSDIERCDQKLEGQVRNRVGEEHQEKNAKRNVGV